MRIARHHTIAQREDMGGEQPTPAGPIEVWRIRTTFRDDPTAALALLAPDERERADRLIATHPRARFIVTRAALRTLLARRTGAEPSSIRIDNSATGKPMLAPDAQPYVHFSVSHAGDLALIAVSMQGAVGIDVERLRSSPRIERIAGRLFDPATCQLLASLPADQRRLAFHHAWTQREAFVKAIGGTLFATRDPLAFRWPRPAQPDIQSGDRDEPWTVAPLDAGTGYAATVVVAGNARRIELLDLDEW